MCKRGRWSGLPTLNQVENYNVSHSASPDYFVLWIPSIFLRVCSVLPLRWEFLEIPILLCAKHLGETAKGNDHCFLILNPLYWQKLVQIVYSDLQSIQKGPGERRPLELNVAGEKNKTPKHRHIYTQRQNKIEPQFCMHPNIKNTPKIYYWCLKDILALETVLNRQHR